LSTYLELVQDLARQSGTLAGGTTLASVSGVSGRADKLVNWIKRAWEDIQNQRTDWLWMNAEWTGTLSIGTRRYTAASFSLTRHRKWAGDTRFWQPLTIYDPAIGQSDETALTQIEWDTWRTKYDRATHDANRPVEYAISPAGELCFGPTPDKAYSARGEYLKSPQALSANSDTPELPSHLHQIIVHRAMVMMGGSDESPITIQTAQNEYRRLFVTLCEEQLPNISLERGNALA
jgi:hypothetical protein